MGRDASKTDAWSDADLTNAVLASRSWRGVLRELGLCATSSGSLRVVKRRVAILRLDTSHFTGQRTWSDATLKRAVAQAHSWNELLSAIGMKSDSGDERIRVKAHALRLGLDLSHLEDQPREAQSRSYAKPALRNLREAATSLAACWFSLCGFIPAIPVGCIFLMGVNISAFRVEPACTGTVLAFQGVSGVTDSDSCWSA